MNGKLDTTPELSDWNRDACLESRPGQSRRTRERDEQTRFYDSLQRALYENDFPETEDRTKSTRNKLPDSGITIVILSSPIECLPILLQGGWSCPGNVHLVLSTSWLSAKQSERNPDLKTVYLHKAISMYEGGCSYLNVFDPPRRVSYLMNNLADDQAVAEYENGLDCPTSSDNKKIDDRIWTRILLSRTGLFYPECLAFCYDVSGYELPPDGANIDLQKVDGQTDVEVLVGKGITKFLERIDSPNCRKIIVKPIRNSYDKRTVSIHDESDYEGICNRAVALLSQVDSGNGVLIEKFYDPGPTAAGKNDVTFRISVITCRGRCDEPISTAVTCGVGRRNEPITGENTTTPQSIETTLRRWGLESAEIDRVRKRVMNDSQNLLRKIMRHENNAAGLTDMIIVDYILTNREGLHAPICIEVKGRRSLKSYRAIEFLDADLDAGAPMTPLIEMMCEKSQKFAMWGKTLVVLGKGRASKQYMWSIAKEDNIKIIIVDRKTGNIPDVAGFIDYDPSDHTRDDQHATNIVELLNRNGLKIDGCCTITEDSVVLCAQICELLSLKGIGVSGAKIAKKKSSCLKTVREICGKYAEKCFHVETERDIDESSVRYPCVMKREFGGGAVGVKLVENIDDAKAYFNLVKRVVESDEVSLISGKSFGTSMMMTRYLEGTEHDVQVVVFDGQLIAAFVCDNGPTRKPSFYETSLCMPSRLSAERAEQLISAAYRCGSAIGLVTGVYNVEMMMTSDGPKLIEINARMGGFYVGNWIRECYGVDFVRCVYMCACGVRPHVYKCRPRGQILGVTCLWSLHAHLLTRMDEIDDLRNSGEVLFYPIYYAPGEVVAADAADFHIGYLGVKADGLDEAKQKLLEVCERFHISSTDYDVEKFIDFRQDTE
ncbi:carnosine synthase 1-like [Tubulanus polymorphus]|uniref:carnosine synthase 1-like n=1 Tax=Tubulanus polymorphus TaxID=672921 RepID=UPI003DA662FF